MGRASGVTEMRRSIGVAAPPDAVFRELVDLHQLTRWSAITETHDGPEVLELGQEFHQTIRVAGVRLRTQWRCVELEPPRLVAYEATGPLGGRLRMRQTVAPTDGGCQVGLEVDYDLPGKFFGVLLDRIYVRGRTGRDAEKSLENLKVLVEDQE